MIAPGTGLLHDNTSDAGRSLLFTQPRRVLTTCRRADVPALLAEAESASAAGLHLAGYLAYELGLAFEERLATLLPAETAFPLLWLGIYDPPFEMDRANAWRWLTQHAPLDLVHVDDIDFSMTRADYDAAFARVMDYIRAGDAYQINLTMRARFGLRGDPVALYRDLCRSQAVAHGALVCTGAHHVLSLSPELFLENRGGRIVTRPMKGTAPRGRSAAEDDAIKAAMQADVKTRAENLMIVDLLRNDLGRIAETGSIKVDSLFAVETYQSLHQMTSTISATLRPDISLGAILRALFPCGSVTGAPKIRAMQIIHEVEQNARGVYTGSIGHIAPTGDFAFNVAIRTAVIDTAGRGEIGIGGGIVADSRVDAEYDECLLKLGFFREAVEPPGLIETLLWTADGFWLFERHLARLAASAAHFGYAFDRTTILAALDGVVTKRDGPLRVRLVLTHDGAVTVTAVALPPTQRLRFMIAGARMESADPLLAHKTTRRAIYDRPREAAAETHDVGEVVFCNERGELTEGSFTNLFIARGGTLLTPPLSAGLLPGVLRAELIATGEAREETLMPDDLATADAIYLGNSVRGLVPAELVTSAS
jgi:para-aminobenzoate synthetase/4-amino-4-deoxychorismate lyase